MGDYKHKSEASTRLQPGTLINQYRVVKHLGTGVLTDVYLVTHTFLNMDRALKVIDKTSPQLTDAIFQSYCERYQAEWQLAASIRHPNVIEVYDVFEFGSFLCAIEEYASNGTLKDYLDVGNRATEDPFLQILRDCATGLAHIHQMTKPPTIHGHVNPRTIVFDKHGTAKITNLGKVHSYKARLRNAHKVSSDEYERRYQAPEYAQGKLAPTTDVYSLGCVAFELLTGISVVETPMRAPRQLDPAVPEWLDRIVSRMLCPTPSYSTHDADDLSKRYGDMQQVLKALDAPPQIVSSQLLTLVKQHFSLDELHTACHELEVDYEDIEGGMGGDKIAFAREMIRYFQRREQLGKLIEYLRLKRPDASW